MKLVNSSRKFSRFLLTLLSGFVFVTGHVGTSAEAGINVWTSNGPEGGAIPSFAIGPVTPTTLYAGTESSGVFRSADRGASWSTTGLTNTNVLALAIDPTTPTILYAGTFGGGVFALTITPSHCPTSLPEVLFKPGTT